MKYYLQAYARHECIFNAVRGGCGRGRMVVRFATAYAISSYHH